MAKAKTHGGSRKGAGAKPLGEKPMKIKAVTLYDHQIAKGKELGNGNLSAGLRLLIDAHMRLDHKQ